MDSTFQWNTRTKVEFGKKLPTRERLNDALGAEPEKILIVYDKRLARTEAVKKWLSEFELHYPVTAGEGLKDLAAFPTHVRRVLKVLGAFSARSVAVVALGGGSIGDFAGFLASVLKRGVPLVHIPSTLLAAMDSAHGGKTALNVSGGKNQLGTFYPASAVILVRSLFEGLPTLQLKSASGELAKMALIAGGDLYERLHANPKIDFETIWSALPSAIEAKYKIVDKDPLERSGERQVLNLGHSLGHALESYYGLPHGLAVGEGLMFAVGWSAHQGYLKRSADLMTWLELQLGFLPPREFARKHKMMSRARLLKLLAQDKKMTDMRHLNFIFLEDVGKPFRKQVTIESFLTETQRQGWTSV